MWVLGMEFEQKWIKVDSKEKGKPYAVIQEKRRSPSPPSPLIPTLAAFGD